MTANIELATAAARRYLERKGYEIVDLGWEDPGCEGSIDVVAIGSDYVLVFVDVSEGCWDPSAADEPRSRCLAEKWLAAHAERDFDGKTMRFDKLYVADPNGRGNVFLKHIVDMSHM